MRSTLDRLAARARERAQLEDFGDDSWREGLTLLIDTLESTPDVNPGGRDDLYRQFVDALWNRLHVVDYRKRHPEVQNERIERPLVILGLPRTGTTLASALLDQDPARRSLLHWEAYESVPPPTTSTLRSDPRCLAKKAKLDEMAAALVEAQFPVPHWEEADGPTECTFVQNQDFKAFLWEAFMPTPAYCDWLLGADMTSTYQYERSVLQILQSKAPGIWSLKMPSHAVNIEALLATFPDARIVWAHRDPFKAAASMISMLHLARGQLMAETDMATFVPTMLEILKAHIDRPLRARRRIGDDRFFDLYYSELMRDPIGQMRALYGWAGDALMPETERAMTSWIEGHPPNRFGVRAYSLSDYGLTRADLAPIFEDYLTKFDIRMESA